MIHKAALQAFSEDLGCSFDFVHFIYPDPPFCVFFFCLCFFDAGVSLRIFSGFCFHLQRLTLFLRLFEITS